MRYTRTASCKNNEHNLAVCSVDGRNDVMDGYFFGVCLTCGDTFEVKYRKLEEAFENGRDE